MNRCYLILFVLAFLVSFSIFNRREENKKRIKLEREEREAMAAVLKPITAEAIEYGGKRFLKTTSLYARDGDRWLPVCVVEEITTNYPPCRHIDRTGMWYTPVGGVDVKKLREEYTPPKPLWEEE